MKECRHGDYEDGVCDHCGYSMEYLIEQLTKERDSLQANIDALMLEYCEDEMTQEQLDNWADHQVIAKEQL